MTTGLFSGLGCRARGWLTVVAVGAAGLVACSQDGPSAGGTPGLIAGRDVLVPADLPQQSNQAVTYYQAWRAQFVMQGPCAADELYVSSLGDAAHDGDISVSEAMGYGLLITALMAGNDVSAQSTFDKMLNFITRRSVASGLPLMTWRIDGTCSAPAGETSATDGELDIAFALLLAQSLWTGGAYDYGALARERIAAIMDHIVQDQNTSHPVLGLWEDVDPQGKFWRAFRFSDIMPRHFRAFAAATGDTRWLTLLSATERYTLLAQQHSPPSLVPDFAVSVDNGLRTFPVPPHFLEKKSDGDYSFNACRVPLRLGHEVLVTPDSPYTSHLRALVAGLAHLSHNDPTQLAGGYDLTGLAINEDTNLGAFIAPLAAGMYALNPGAAASNPFLAGLTPFDPTEPYYGSTLRMVALSQMGL